ncbi:hypothetical protein A0H81_00884 [Grifola frondosa]|uniref:Uncharacterized protein n=1 Tax=Grifola frondosa TaxID=5627 RepID=A0A1C7MR04_GRIFR|nr:hypothetical protein A0H81_00884 [Grifola frondosa]
MPRPSPWVELRNVVLFHERARSRNPRQFSDVSCVHTEIPRARYLTDLRRLPFIHIFRLRWAEFASTLDDPLPNTAHFHTHRYSITPLWNFSSCRAYPVSSYSIRSIQTHSSERRLGLEVPPRNHSQRVMRELCLATCSIMSGQYPPDNQLLLYILGGPM